MKKLSIIIPAKNEQDRIVATLVDYATFFDHLVAQGILNYELVVVSNGSTDATVAVVQEVAKNYPALRVIDHPQAGKGLAIAVGFADALTRANDLIGFVDADMATRPHYFYDVVQACDGIYDGAIASRYMPGSQVIPPRPWIKYWGSRLIYDKLVNLLFGMDYYDFQCGAKVFRRSVVMSVVNQLTIKQWAFDVELLYLCKRSGFAIREIPTTWYDQVGSKLNMFRSGMRMLGSVIKLRMRHSPLKLLMSNS